MVYLVSSTNILNLTIFLFMYIIVKKYFQSFLNELHLKYYFLSSDVTIVIFGSKLTVKYIQN